MNTKPNLNTIVNVGPYNLAYYSDTHVSILDTRTNESGSFLIESLNDTLVAALDTFFMENF